jgi:site-specific DNA-methyltransferase (adenine-specific)
MTKFGVIIADAPWRYRNKGCKGAAADQYPTMTVDELCRLRVQDVSAEDAVLLMWATWPLLIEAVQVIKAWGFVYVTGMPWVKVQKCENDLWNEWHIKAQFGVGFWVRGASEPILICRRGNPKMPSKDFVGLLSPNIRHSRKPENIYEYAELLPGPYLELFSRKVRPGWSVYGNEVKSDVVL